MSDPERLVEMARHNPEFKEEFKKLKLQSNNSLLKGDRNNHQKIVSDMEKEVDVLMKDLRNLKKATNYCQWYRNNFKTEQDFLKKTLNKKSDELLLSPITGLKISKWRFRYKPYTKLAALSILIRPDQYLHFNGIIDNVLSAYAIIPDVIRARTEHEIFDQNKDKIAGVFNLQNMGYTPDLIAKYLWQDTRVKDIDDQLKNIEMLKGQSDRIALKDSVNTNNNISVSKSTLLLGLVKSLIITNQETKNLVDLKELYELLTDKYLTKKQQQEVQVLIEEIEKKSKKKK